MESKIKIDYVDRGTGRGMEPLIRVDVKNSDDPRDKLITTLFQSLGDPTLQISWGDNKWRTTQSGLLEADTTIFIFKPEKKDGSYLIRDNSTGFRNFLDSEKISWRGEEHSTLLYLEDPVQLFELGKRIVEYKANHPNG
jgi:hypothetical protein